MRGVLVASLLVAFLAALSGCSAFLGGDVQTIVCHATKEPVQCAPKDDAPRAYRIFTEYIAPIDPDLPIIINWYDWDHLFDHGTGDVAGWSNLNVWPYEIHVRNTGVMMHELNHVFLYEETGSADANHEEPGEGSWGKAHNAAIELAADAFGTTNGTPCPPEVCDDSA